MQRDLLEYIAFLVSSAENLQMEPATYGPLRLIDAAERVIALFERLNMLDDPQLSALAQDIHQNKFSCMDEPEAFSEMLKHANLQLAKIVKNSKED